MIKRIKTHLLLLLFMYFVFTISTLVYGRNYSLKEWLHVALVYGVYVLVLYSINIIKKRWIKWVIFGGFFFFPLSFFIIVGANLPDITSKDALLSSAPINVPFLPEYINYPSQYPGRVILIFYVLYFLLPLIYWYGLYILSKRIVAKTGKNMAKNAE